MSKKTYILVDTLNMFFRAKHVGGGRDIDMRVGMAMHIMFNSIKKYGVTLTAIMLLCV